MKPEQLARLPAVLFEIGKLIGSDLDPGILLSRISELICQLVNAKACSVMLLDASRKRLLDYDDVTLDGHPSAVLVPAILAQGEALGSSGAQMLAAYAAGYEVWAELLVREPVPLHQKGWHPTAVRGTIAAAAACSKLRGLDAEATGTALAVAGSMAGGLVAIAFSPIGRAIARRIGGGKVEESEVAELRADVADLRAELDARLGQVDELQERLDFAERALAQVKARDALPGARQ